MQREQTYVWFSPLGARIHAAAQKIAVTRSPMKGAQLRLLARVPSKSSSAPIPVRHCVSLCVEKSVGCIEAATRQCGDAVSCLELECDDACAPANAWRARLDIALVLHGKLSIHATGVRAATW